MKWTKEQQNVIDFRNRDILVSAAAGSGKTAVLVARIIQRILDPQNPVDIDRLLVAENHRYLVAEDTTALFTVTGKTAVVNYCGFYSIAHCKCACH